MMNRSTWLLMALLLAPSVPTLAAETPAGAEQLNRIEFQVRAERETANDLMQATLVAEHEDTDPGRLAAELNRTMAWALEHARSAGNVDARSGDYRTFPVYNQRRITQWRATQELALESRSPEQLNALIGRLQERLQVRGMLFTVSPEQRAKLEETLTAEALDRFRQRAAAIAERLGAAGYDIVQLQIHDDSGRMPPVIMARAMAVAEDQAVASEPGTSRIAVVIHAAIRLHF